MGGGPDVGGAALGREADEMATECVTEGCQEAAAWTVQVSREGRAGVDVEYCGPCARDRAVGALTTTDGSGWGPVVRVECRSIR